MKALWISRVAVPLLAVIAAPANAADLTNIDRSIEEEPAYKGRPTYCLLMFGPEARTKIWLVQGLAVGTGGGLLAKRKLDTSPHRGAP